MLTLYTTARKKPLLKMTYEELVSHYCIPKDVHNNMAKNDIIQYIRQNTLVIGWSNGLMIKTVCIKTSTSCIYLDILC